MTEFDSEDRPQTANVTSLLQHQIDRGARTNPSGIHSPSAHTPAHANNVVSFNRHELRDIMGLYGRKVAAGEWRDYAMDFTPQKAIFSIYRRTSEVPLFRIEKDPRLTRKQGTYCVITPTGLILKRGDELLRVIKVLEKPLKLVK
jgi:hypothetical protein